MIAYGGEKKYSPCAALRRDGSSLQFCAVQQGGSVAEWLACWIQAQ